MSPRRRHGPAAAAVRELFADAIRATPPTPCKRASVVFSIGSAPNSDYWPLLADVDRLLAGFSARAHWGKNHFLTRDRLRELYPRYEDFVRIRRELDPNGIFLNDHMRALVG